MRILTTILIGLMVLPAVSADKLAQRLEQHAVELSENIGERNVYLPTKLEAAAKYIEKQFKDAGYVIDVQTYTARGQMFKNLEIEKKGNDEIIIIGAHYDTNKGTPGADDNGSGIAVLLELAKLVKNATFNKTVRFVAFSTEEVPLFKTSGMGSYVYAKQAKKKNENIVAMISLEMIGYYSDEKGSQHYPLWYGIGRPSEGNFIGVVSNFRSRHLKDQVATLLKPNFPVESAWGFGFIPGFDWSDHWSFWQFNYPAIMITDTALYRNPHYHSNADTPETLDYEKMSDLTKGLAETLSILAQ